MRGAYVVLWVIIVLTAGTSFFFTTRTYHRPVLSKERLPAPALDVGLITKEKEAVTEVLFTSEMAGLFWRAKTSAPTLDVIANLHSKSETLGKREHYLQMKCDNTMVEAQRFVSSGDKKAAIRCLRQKKLYEKQISTVCNGRDKIDIQIAALEGATTNMETLDALKYGALALSQIHNKLNVDDIDKLMEEVRKQQDISEEINDSLTQPFGNEADENDLIDGIEFSIRSLSNVLPELDRMVEESTATKLLELPISPVSTLCLPAAVPPVTDDLTKLEASLAM